MGEIVRRVLSCGVTALIERMDGVHSAAMCVSLPVGAAADPHDRQGLTSILSELVQRGAGERDSRAQADAFDRIGCVRSVDVGVLNFHISATMVGARLSEAMPLILDMVRRPRFDPAQLEPCRDLAMQSLASLADDPQERAMLAAKRRHHPSPHDRSGYGDAAGLGATTIDDIKKVWATRALPVGSIIGIAGAVDPEATLRQLDALLDGWSGEAPGVDRVGDPPRGYEHEADQSNQVQILLVQDAPAEPESASMVERVLTGVLSGGMSARLFTEVREKRGLCYAVSAAYRAERDFGVRTAYVGTTPERAQESLDTLAGELARVGTPTGRVERDEFERSIIGLKSRVVFSGESTGARAGSLVSDERRLGRPRSLSELLSQVEAVTLDGVNEHAEAYARGRWTIQTLGPEPLRPPANLS
ncbi:MAG: pitrilysin family protein [Planctomycetota bacterium]